MTEGDAAALPAPGLASRRRRGDAAPTSTRAERVAQLLRSRWELFSLLAFAAILNLWSLTRNGWANDYYSAAVRSMAGSLHNFLYASFDPNGVMTVDKPPLALWVQVASVKLFGYHPLSVLVPQALMGLASIALLYDLTRRHFGRGAGFVAGLVLATTPVTVGISRHNNPDALLVLCCVAALWFFVRALEDGRTRWIVLSGICVGLGFETKMLVALMVVPGIVVAWLWLAPRGRAAALRQLLAGGAALLVVGGAWPLLVVLTPASDRPWISGTADNSIFSLIFGYNGLGRVNGQAGGPAGGGGTMFGGTPGPLRLLNNALGGQDGWLLGFAVVSAIALLAVTRLRRRDARSGWLLAIGGAFVTTAVVFSYAKGIFHPYYVSLLAPFAAALVGAGAALLVRAGTTTRVLAALAVGAGVATELAVLHSEDTLSWLAPLLVAGGVVLAAALLLVRDRRVRIAAVAATIGLLSIAPATWAFDTLGHAESGTFPAGGPASVSFGGPGGGPGPGGGRFGGGGGGGGGFRPQGGFAPPAGGAGAGGGFAPPQGGVASLFGGGNGPGGGGFGGFGGGGGFAGGAGAFGGGDASLSTVLSYAKEHGGGAVAVASQSSAAGPIISSGAEAVGIGGFSGRESDVSLSWFAREVRSGAIRWVIADTAGGPGLPGDTRAGSSRVMAAVRDACTATTSGGVTFYDCGGRASALLAAG